MLLQRRCSCVREDEQSCLSREPRSAQSPKETREGDEEGSQEAEEGAGQDVQGKSEEDPLPEAQLLTDLEGAPSLSRFRRQGGVFDFRTRGTGSQLPHPVPAKTRRDKGGAP